MVKKFKLYAIGNDENFNYYLFDKKQKIAEELSKIFRRVFNLYWEFEDYSGKKGTFKKKNIEKLKDQHESLTSSKGKNRGDIFYGNKKMFISIQCSQKLRCKFNQELELVTIMPKPKKLKNDKKIFRTHKKK